MGRLMTDDLVKRVERALCCLNGPCRALEAGRIADCGAEKTVEHAKAAIDVVQAAYRDKIRALATIRKDAGKLADELGMAVEGTGGAYEPQVRALAKIASDALA